MFDIIFEVLAWILFDVIFKLLGIILKYPGGFIISVLGGFKKPIDYSLELDNYGFIPHVIGLILYGLIIFAILKFFT